MFNTITNKIPVIFFTQIGKNPKIYMEPHTHTQQQQLIKTILRNNKAGSITFPDFKLYYKKPY